MGEKKDINGGFTLTSIMLLFPLFGTEYRTYKNCGFINAYLGDPEKSYESDRKLIYTVFKAQGEAESYLSVLIQEMMDDNMVADVYDRNGYTVIVLLLPERFDQDYKRFLKGEYSKFSNFYRETCPQVGVSNVTGNKYLSSQLRIVNRDPTWREFVEEFYDIHVPEDGEVHERPLIEKETINWSIWQ